MSLLAAFALIAAQGSGADNYHAVGAAPLWQARIADGYVRFETPGQDATGLGPTVPEVTRQGFTYRSDGDPGPSSSTGRSCWPRRRSPPACRASAS